MSCASVNKGWQQACTHIRPEAITVQTKRNIRLARRQPKLISRVWQLDSQGCLQHLQRVTVITDVLFDTKGLLRKLATLPLQHLEIQAAGIDAQWAVQHLPATLTHFALSCALPPVLCLTSFGKYASLASLHLVSERNVVCHLHVDHPIPSLQDLSFTSVRKCAGISMESCRAIPACLPNLRKLALTESASSSSLQDLFNIPSLHELALELRAIGISEGRAPVDLFITNSSNLRKVNLTGPHALVTLVLRKANVEVVSTGVKVINGFAAH